MIQQYSVSLLEGFNNAKFGMQRSAVRAVLGEPVREFKKSKLSKTTIDDYSFFHVFYDKDDNFEAVEFFSEVEIKVNNDVIFPSSIEKLKTTEYDFNVDGDGLISTKYSIGVYAPNGVTESILFGVKDYYL